MLEIQSVARRGDVGDTPEVLRLAALMYESIGIDVSGAQWRRVAADHISERLWQDAALFVVDDPRDKGRLAATGAATIARRLPSPGNPDARIGYVQWISTDPAWRRRGFARQIMLALLDWLRDNDVMVVELHAAPMGEKLYQELGFQEGKSPALRLRLDIGNVFGNDFGIGTGHEPAPEKNLPRT